MSDARIQGYARALFEIARAEGTLDEVEDELFRFARSYESSEELRTALTDDQVPAEKRQAIVEDLLGGKATSTTTQLVSMVVGSGRGRDLPAIVDQLVQRAAGSKDLDVADASVLGGIVATIGDTVIDDTVRTRIDQLKSRL
jgi:F-type H+-transporting ATPase subunit delta